MGLSEQTCLYSSTTLAKFNQDFVLMFHSISQKITISFKFVVIATKSGNKEERKQNRGKNGNSQITTKN